MDESRNSLPSLAAIFGFGAFITAFIAAGVSVVLGPREACRDVWASLLTTTLLIQVGIGIVLYAVGQVRRR